MAHKKMKQTPMTRTFLRELADTIYNSRNRTFLRLCDGTLQNGPDPTDKKRPMHCGLGELYYAMTGLQPEETNVTEDDVVELALERSSHVDAETARHKAESAIDALDISVAVKDELHRALDNQEDTDFLSENALDFKSALKEIPDRNDDGCGHSTDVDEDETVCTISDFRERSKRVATQLRLAATFLPRD